MIMIIKFVTCDIASVDNYVVDLYVPEEVIGQVQDASRSLACLLIPQKLVLVPACWAYNSVPRTTVLSPGGGETASTCKCQQMLPSILCSVGAEDLYPTIPSATGVQFVEALNMLIGEMGRPCCAPG